MNIDEFVEFAKKRRSIRLFKADPVPDECIEKMLEAARWAPSAINAQPWEFIVVKNKRTRNKITRIIEETWRRSYDIERTRVVEVRHPWLVDEKQGTNEAWGDAPVFIAVCGDPRVTQAFMLTDAFYPLEGGQKAIFFKSMANPVLILEFAASACGLGALQVSVHSTSEAVLKELLGVPVELSLQTIVPVGYPAREPPASWRRPLKEMVHYEKYDPAKYRSGEDIYNYLVNHRKRFRPIYPKKTKS